MQAANQQNAALELRLAQAAERNNQEENEGAGIAAEQPGMSLRQRRLLAKKQTDQAAKNAASKDVQSGSEAASQGMRFVTARLLRAAWLSEGTIVGFLIGLAYINLHVFLRLVLGPAMFCRLGEEWSLGRGDGAGKMASAGAFWAEVTQLILFDLLIFAVLAFVCFWLYLFAQLITEPWEFVMKNGLTLFKALWDMIRTKLTS